LVRAQARVRVRVAAAAIAASVGASSKVGPRLVRRSGLGLG